MKPQITLITGASSGIGMHLAHEFASHGHPLVLVAPVDSELAGVALEIEQAHGVTVRTIAKDLENPDAPSEIFYELQRDGVAVDILVNNAGHGQSGKWWEIPINEDISMVRLNIEAVLRLTKLFLPPMIERGHGRLLTTASVAGFEPGPLLNTYHSTKAFILSWSEALAIELKDTPITVTALCPGPTDTDFFPKADLESSKVFQKGKVMAPQDVAKAGYEALMDGELFVVPGVMNKALVTARRFLTEEAQAKMNEKMYEDAPPDDRERERGDVENKVRG